MKNLIIFVIIMNLCLLSLNSEERIQTNKQFQKISRQVEFNYRLVKALTLSKNQEIMQLKTIVPGSKVKLTKEENKAVFEIDGEPNQIIKVNVDISCESNDIIVNKILLGTIKKGESEKETSILNEIKSFSFSSTIELSTDGKAEIDISPIEITTKEKIDLNKIHFLIVNVHCEYNNL